MNKGYIKYDLRLKERARKNRKNPTKAEKHIWDHILKNSKFFGYKFTRQKMLGFFIVDFYCSEIKVAIEIDGDVHDDRGEYDDERTIELNKLGIKVIRYTNEEVLSDIQKVYSYLKEEFMFLCNENDNPSQPLEPLPASGTPPNLPLSGEEKNRGRSRTKENLPLTRGIEGVFTPDKGDGGGFVGYDNFATTFASSRNHMKWEEIEYFFSSYHEDLVGKKICDIGCGSGRLLEQEHISPDNYVGVDSSKELLRIAEGKFEGYNFVHKNMQQIDDIGKNDFDSLLFIASFHHLKTLEERIQVLERSRSILQKNGKIFMINWSLQSNININKYKESMILDSKNDFYSCDFDIKIGEHKRFYHSFSLSELEYLFHKTGFEIIENREFENQRNIISIIKKSGD